MLQNLRKDLVAALSDAEAEIAAMGGSVTGRSAISNYTSKSKATTAKTVASRATRADDAGSERGSVTPALSVVSEEH